MKKLLIIYAVIPLFLIQNTNAQNMLAQFKDDTGLWGYMNNKGEVVIPAQYSAAKDFSIDGFALVKEKNSKVYYYIDIKGNKLELSCNPEGFGNFSDGRAMVKINGLWGYIDTSGKLEIQAKYDKASDFSDGKAIVQDASGKIYLIDIAGAETDLSALNITNFKEFREGLARVEISGTNWGFLNTEGKIAIEAKYLKVGDFSAGLAWTRVAEKQIGYMDKTGKIVIDPQYVYVKNFDPVSERALVKNSNDEMFYIDKQGNKLAVDAGHYNDFSDGYCSLDKAAAPGIYGFIDKDGNWKIEPAYESTGDFHNGVCRVRVNKLWGLIDKNGKILIEPKYNGLEDFTLIK
jgi:hypothetical protein